MYSVLRELVKRSRDVVTAEERRRVRDLLREAVEAGRLGRDAFGLNPVVMALETALVVAREIGVSRATLIGAMVAPTGGGGFGADVERVVDGLHRIADLYAKSASVETENFRNLLVTFAEDMRVILLMIANRVAIMRQIRDTENISAQRRIASEAAFLYAPLAHKLGLYKLKSELEDLSLKYLEHDAYYHIKEKLNATKAARDSYIARFIAPIDERLREAGLTFHMKGRTKSIHSIYQKMKKQRVDVDGVYDLFAIRIILESRPEREKQDCWQVFSIITDMYQSNPRRMRDWLSVPKSNGYESLHITVLGPERKWVEVQIRTERMDDVAEHGLAAHWRYKGVGGSDSGVENWLANIRAALETGDDMKMMDQFRQDLIEDEVFVFTPRGDLFKLPLGATVLDFAYRLHSKVGNACVGARIGGRNVTIRQKLVSGDQVEILTSAQQRPKQDWLNIVTTSRARAKIRQSLKEMQAAGLEIVKEDLVRKLKNRKIDFDEPTLMHTIKRLGFKVVTDFYAALSSGATEMNDVLDAYAQQLRHDRGEDERTTPMHGADSFKLEQDERRSEQDVMVIDQNVKGIDFAMARCCQPVYGDDVFGFVTSGGVIKIHRNDCPNATQMRERFGYRIVEARWAGKRGSQYPITLQVVGNDDLGIVNNITSIISREERILLRSISIDSHDGLFSGRLTVMIDDTSRLQQLIRKLKTVRGVKNVTRA